MNTLHHWRRGLAALALAAPLLAAAQDAPGGLPGGPNGPPNDPPPNQVPEPGTWLLVGLAAAAAARSRRK